jgi:hypothetical protein
MLTLVSMSQLTVFKDPNSYCLYSLYNKMRDKGKIVSAGYRGGWRGEVGSGVGAKGGVRVGGRNDPSIVCT